jgi:hypothetical protein
VSPLALQYSSDGEKIEVRNVNVPNYRAMVHARQYEIMKAALLRVLPNKEPGLTQAEMFNAARAAVSSGLFPGTTHMWWVKCVQLDLEARGEIKRDPNSKPLRWIKT